MIKEIGGKMYKSVPEIESGVCTGCAFERGSALCTEASNCGHGTIWKLVVEDKQIIYLSPTVLRRLADSPGSIITEGPVTVACKVPPKPWEPKRGQVIIVWNTPSYELLRFFSHMSNGMYMVYTDEHLEGSAVAWDNARPLTEKETGEQK